MADWRNKLARATKSFGQGGNIKEFGPRASLGLKGEDIIAAFDLQLSADSLLENELELEEILEYSPITREKFKQKEIIVLDY